MCSLAARVSRLKAAKPVIDPQERMAPNFSRPYSVAAFVPAVDTAAATAVGAFDRPPPSREPAEELSRGLAQLHQRLNVLTARSRTAAVDDQSLGARLEELYGYLVEDLTPLLYGLSVRVHPALRRLGALEPGQRSANEHARLLRLTERIAALRAQYILGGDSRELRGQTITLVEELSALATDYLSRAEYVIPAALRRLRPLEAARIVEALRRTVDAVHDDPRRELQAGLL